MFASMVKVLWSAFEYMQQMKYADDIFRTKKSRVIFFSKNPPMYAEAAGDMAISLALDQTNLFTQTLRSQKIRVSSFIFEHLIACFHSTQVLSWGIG